MKNKNCKCCDKEFKPKYSKQLFCCRSCSASYNNTHRRADHYKIVERICTKCGNICKVNSHTPISKVLCTNCMPEKNQKINVKKRYRYDEWIERWLNGLEDGVVGHDAINKKIKKYLFNKYNNKCQICGWGKINDFTGKIPLQVHHINGDCRDNKIENLQLLCPNCHALTDNYCSRNKNCTRKNNPKYIKHMGG